MRWVKWSYLMLIPWFNQCQRTDITVTPQQRDWVESVYASSKVEARDQYEHRAEVNGRLVSYAVKEGDVVQAGQLIAVLDGVVYEDRLNIARTQRELAVATQSKLKELQNQIQQSKISLIKDSTDFERQKRLYTEGGIGSQSQLEFQKLKYEQGSLFLASLHARYSALSGEVQAQLKQADHNIRLAKNQLNAYYVYALKSGKVYELHAEIGDLVGPQQPIAFIGNSVDFLVEMEIDERDISKIQRGQEVIVKLDAYPQTVQAEIVHISQRLDAQSQTFHAKAQLKGTLPSLYPGLTAESNIIIQRKKRVWVLPARAVNESGVIETSQGTKTVKTGLRNTQWVEILSGVDANTQIILPR